MEISRTLFLLLATVVSADIVPLHPASRALPNSYIVKLKSGYDVDSVLDEISREAAAALPRSDVIIQETFQDVFHGFVAKLSLKALQYIRKLEVVEYVAENGLIPLPGIHRSNYRLDRLDHRAASTPWHLDRIDQMSSGPRLDYKYSPPNHGENVEIWVVDTGIRKSHAEFNGRSVRIAYDVDNNNGVDPWGHGTLCTSVAAGNIYGSANKANIVVAKVISGYSGGLGTWAAVMKALEIMVQTAQKPAVASISLGQGGTNKALEDAVISTMDEGFTVAVAAGNENYDACASFPANFKRVITVGASTKTDARWASSNHGTCVDIFSPGKDIIGAYINGDYDTEIVSGTSEATPILAGAAAILLSSQPDLTHDQVKAKLISNAIPNVLQEPLPAGSPNLLLHVQS